MSTHYEHVLQYTTVDSVGFDKLGFTLLALYANVDSPFSVEDYAEDAGIALHEINADSIKAMNDAASHEGPSSWIMVSHTTHELWADELWADEL